MYIESSHFLHTFKPRQFFWDGHLPSNCFAPNVYHIFGSMLKIRYILWPPKMKHECKFYLFFIWWSFFFRERCQKWLKKNIVFWGPRFAWVKIRSKTPRGLNWIMISCMNKREWRGLWLAVILKQWNVFFVEGRVRFKTQEV